MKFFCFMLVVLAGMLPGSASANESIGKQLIVLADSASTDGVVTGKDGWLFLQEELVHLGSPTFFGLDMAGISKASKPEFADPLPAIVDFNNQLKERNIDLIFVPVPPKALIYPDKLSGDFSKETTAELQKPYEALYAELRKEGVQVLDLIPIYSKAREKKQVYCKTDSHFSGQGLELAAKGIGELLKKSIWYPESVKTKYELKQKTVDITGDLSLMRKSTAKESLKLDFVTDPQTGKNIVPDAASPVLLLGDSHTLVFSVGGDLHATGAGLFDQLSATLGFAVDRIGVRGSGATPSRIKLYQRSRKYPNMLAGKKVVVWCLSSRELTGSGGWRKIPVAKME
jgi:alginate O-acetyltransferase complex protein AlgJ